MWGRQAGEEGKFEPLEELHLKEVVADMAGRQLEMVLVQEVVVEMEEG